MQPGRAAEQQVAARSVAAATDQVIAVAARLAGRARDHREPEGVQTGQFGVPQGTSRRRAPVSTLFRAPQGPEPLPSWLMGPSRNK